MCEGELKAKRISYHFNSCFLDLALGFVLWSSYNCKNVKDVYLTEKENRYICLKFFVWQILFIDSRQFDEVSHCRKGTKFVSCFSHIAL